MTFTPPEVYEKVKERAGGLCEGIVEDSEGQHRCCSPGDWRKLSMHHEPCKSRVPTRHVYTEKEVYLMCYPCHEKLLGQRML